MCAEAVFSDQSGDPAGQFFRAAEFGQNFMQRRQRQQWEQEDRTENQRVRTLFEPVLQAQRQAQVATALSSLETNKQQQQLRTRFAAEAPKYDKLYQDAMALPTFEAQEAALAQIQPQVTWMGLIPEGQGFVDAVNNSRALAFKSTMADNGIQKSIDLAAQNNAARLAEIQERNKGYLATAQVRADAPDSSQRLLQNLERAQAGGDPEEIAFYQAKYNKAVRQPGDVANQIATYRQQAAQYPVGSQQAKDLNALADKLSGQSGAFDLAQFANAIKNFGQPAGTTTTPPVTTPVVTGTKVVTPAPVGSGTTTTTTIVKDPGFVW